MNEINFRWFLSVAGITWILAVICICIEQITICKIFLIPSIISFVVRIWLSFNLFSYEGNKIKFEYIDYFLNAPIIN